MNQNTSLLFYTNNKDYTKLDPKESKDINIIVGKRSKQDVIKRVAVEFNTFLSALFYSPQILQTLNKQKYIMEKQKELFEPCFQKEIVQELNNLHVLFEESLLEYKKTNETTKKTILLDMFEKEDIMSYIHGSIGDDDQITINELKEIIETIYEEIEKEYLNKIQQEKNYKTSTIEKFKISLLEEATLFISKYLLPNVKKEIIHDNNYDFKNLQENLSLYEYLMSKDMSLPNLLIINSETMKLYEEYKCNIDPQRKCIVLFYFPGTNEFERVIYESYCCPSESHVDSKDYTMKKRNKEEYYRCYLFDSSHQLVNYLL